MVETEMVKTEMVEITLLAELSVSKVIGSCNTVVCYIRPGDYNLIEIPCPIASGGLPWYVLSGAPNIGAPREYWENPNRKKVVIFISKKRTAYANPPKKKQPGSAFRGYMDRDIKRAQAK